MKEQDSNAGIFVISLDFELFWGMFDKETIASYGERIAGERTAIPRMLSMFKEYEIHATWATVGMLMTRSKAELTSLLPPQELRPIYTDESMSSYKYIKISEIGDDETKDIYHFGSNLMEQIIATPFQEIANHTFSHFYCVDGHKNAPEIFEADLDAHAKISRAYGIETSTIVFPRNQASEEALASCKKKGLIGYRGNENHFLYKPRKDKEQTLFVRGLRLLDHYLNISGHHTYPLPRHTDFVNVPASRFLRPWSKKLRFLEPLRLRRIKKAMTVAAKRGEVFHLWWHPHNFGIDQEKNFANLRSILEHYSKLNKTYGMESMTMEEVALEATK